MILFRGKHNNFLIKEMYLSFPSSQCSLNQTTTLHSFTYYQSKSNLSVSIAKNDNLLPAKVKSLAKTYNLLQFKVKFLAKTYNLLPAKVKSFGIDRKDL